MFEAKCYDRYNNSVDSFTQWDIDQTIYIHLEACGDDHIYKDHLTIAPEVHFSNVKREKALVVRSVIAEDKNIQSVIPDVIEVKVPNVLLTEPYPILIYVYLTDSRDVSSQTVIVRTELPVRRRSEPHDYYYVENIERITAEMIKEEIEQDVKKIKEEAIDDITAKSDEATKLIDDAIDDLTAIKNDASNFITAKTTEAVDKIESTLTETHEYIQKELDEFDNAYENLIDQVQDIKKDTQQIYEDTRVIADQTAAEIEGNIRTMMLENGVELKVDNDGTGICIMSIVISQEQEQ